MHKDNQSVLLYHHCFGRLRIVSKVSHKSHLPHPMTISRTYSHSRQQTQAKQNGLQSLPKVFFAFLKGGNIGNGQNNKQYTSQRKSKWSKSSILCLPGLADSLGFYNITWGWGSSAVLEDMVVGCRMGLWDSSQVNTQRGRDHCVLNLCFPGVRTCLIPWVDFKLVV